jgi:hypothetical protein
MLRAKLQRPASANPASDVSETCGGRTNNRKTQAFDYHTAKMSSNPAGTTARPT